MVKTDTSIEDLPPAERIKKLQELRQRREEELRKGEEDFRRLQEERERSLRETDDLLGESFDDLALEEEEAAKQQSSSLEAVVASERGVPEPRGVVYESPLERLMPSTLYELSDYNLYGELRRIEEKGYLTSDEQRRLSELQRQASAITESYDSSSVRTVDEHRGNYLSRTENVLQRLDQKAHDLQHGLYDLDHKDHDRQEVTR
jgi:hypothetical protein